MIQNIPQVQITASGDGTPLLLRHALGVQRSGPTVLLGHGPAVHSGLCLPTMDAFAEVCAAVWAGDLRGHGGSVSKRAPLAHLDPSAGWEQLVEDTLHFAKLAFAGVPRDQRVLVGGGISGHLMLDALSRDPGLARHLVMAGPTPRQTGIMRLASSFMRLRALTHAPDRPDPQIQHHLYAFLRAHLPPGSRNIDVISADPAVIERVLNDPRGFPVPTLNYWRSILLGADALWQRIMHGMLPPDLRVLILTGPEDPQTRGGRLAQPILSWFADQGVTDADLALIDGVRANVLIDADRLPIVSVVIDWFNGTRETGRASPLAETSDETGAYANAHALIGLEPSAELPTLPLLIDLCYAELEDDSRWIEMIYRLSQMGEKDDVRLDRRMTQLQPHWARAFELRQNLLQAAVMGQLYEQVLGRLGLGVALVSEDGVLMRCNTVYSQALARLFNAGPDTIDPIGLTLDLLARTQLRRGAAGPLKLGEQVVGVHFEPAPSGQEAGGPSDDGSQILVLRDPGSAMPEREYRAGLLSLAYGLTARESDVVVRLIEGLSTGAIGADLGMSEHTVRSHFKQVFDKMRVTSRVELSQRVLSGPLGWMTDA